MQCHKHIAWTEMIHTIKVPYQVLTVYLWLVLPFCSVLDCGMLKKTSLFYIEIILHVTDKLGKCRIIVKSLKIIPN
jgi:hypothetical protein